MGGPHLSGLSSCSPARRGNHIHLGFVETFRVLASGETEPLTRPQSLPHTPEVIQLSARDPPVTFEAWEMATPEDTPPTTPRDGADPWDHQNWLGTPAAPVVAPRIPTKPPRGPWTALGCGDCYKIPLAEVPNSAYWVWAEHEFFLTCRQCWLDRGGPATPLVASRRSLPRLH